MATLSIASRRALTALVLVASAQSHAWAQVDLPLPPNPQGLSATGEETNQGPGNPPATLRFGTSLALSLDGETALVGMPDFRALDNDQPGIGRVAIFTRQGIGPWARTGSLDSPVPQEYMRFGMRVAMDGDVALVGSPDRVFVFRRIHRVWTFVQEITAATGEVLDGPLAVEDGSLLVGASVSGQPGVVHVLAQAKKRLWHVVQNLHAFRPAEGDVFGESLAIAHGTLVVGAPGYLDGQGAAFVYQHFGHFYFPYARLFASDRRPGDGFGASVATDGELIAVGAPNANARSANGCSAFGASGEAYVFGAHRFRWTQQQIVVHPNSDCIAGFAGYVAIGHHSLAASTPSLFPYQFDGTLVYNRVQGRYEPTYFAELEEVGVQPLVMHNRTLLIGAPSDRFFSTGYAVTFDLDENAE